MSRDYGSRRPAKQRSSTPQQVLVIAFSFLLGYFTATVFDVEKLTHWMNTEVLAAHESKPQPTKPVPHQAQLPPKPKFEFYTLLANEKGSKEHNAAQNTSSHASTTEVAAKSNESQIPQAAIVKGAETKPVVSSQPNNVAFLVQVASFKMRKDAEQMKATLTLKGYDVNVVAIQAQGTWFRVVVGPYHNKLLAQQAQATLAKNERLRGMVKSAAV
jgi:cell division protein FtsN